MSSELTLLFQLVPLQFVCYFGTWREVVRVDCQARKMDKEDAIDCCKWRKMIKDVR